MNSDVAIATRDEEFLEQNHFPQSNNHLNIPNTQHNNHGLVIEFLNIPSNPSHIDPTIPAIPTIPTTPSNNHHLRHDQNGIDLHHQTNYSLSPHKSGQEDSYKSTDPHNHDSEWSSSYNTIEDHNTYPGGVGGANRTNSHQQLKIQPNYKAFEYRSTCSQSVIDPNTKSGRLYHKMSSIVGGENILKPPTKMTDDEDKVRWLKSDSNTLLYWFYKSTKNRQKIQAELDRNLCSHYCYDYNNTCRWGCGDIAWMGCTALLFPILGIVWCVKCGHEYNKIDSITSQSSPPGQLPIGDYTHPWSFAGTPDELYSYLDRGSVSKAKLEGFYTKNAILPLERGGFRVSDEWFSCGCPFWTCFCHECYKYRYQDVLRMYIDMRYGGEINNGMITRHPIASHQPNHTNSQSSSSSSSKRRHLQPIVPSPLYQDYLEDCKADTNHPFNTIVEEGPNICVILKNQPEAIGSEDCVSHNQNNNNNDNNNNHNDQILQARSTSNLNTNTNSQPSLQKSSSTNQPQPSPLRPQTCRIGDLEHIFPSVFSSAKPFAELDINKFSHVIALHNYQWSQVHPIVDPKLIRTDIIFPGQVLKNNNLEKESQQDSQQDHHHQPVITIHQ